MISGTTVKNRLLLAVVQINIATEQWEGLAGDREFAARLDMINDELRAAIRSQPPLIGDKDNGEKALILGDPERDRIQTE